MKFSAVELTGGVKQTGAVMHRLAREYSFDMSDYGSLPPTEMFRRLAEIPFRPDPKGHELVQRPKFTMTYGGDCDDKSIAAAAYFIIRGTEYRFLAVATNNNLMKNGKIPLTHVFVEFNSFGEWVAFDCTYSYNILGQRPTYFRSEII